MDIIEIVRTEKYLTQGTQSLRNSTDTSQEMEVPLPPESINHDGNPVFYDTVNIRTNSGAASGVVAPTIMIGGSANEPVFEISVHDMNANVKSESAALATELPSINSSANGRKIGFARIPFTYTAQVFQSSYEPKLIQVDPYSTIKAKTAVVQTHSKARFSATFTMETFDKKHVQFKIPGEVTFTQHKFEVIAQPGRGCCG